MRRPRPFRRRLPIPRVLTGADLTIPIRPAKLQILPGRKTRMWTYGGTFPGPTIRRPAGEATAVTFTHRLPRKAGELSVHLHGGHNAAEHDGQPGGLTALQPRSLYCDVSPGLSARESGSDLLIGPGESRAYLYGGYEDGAENPERGAFQWYHDHRMDRTGRNVWRGLAGMWIIDHPDEEPLNLPTGARDIPLMITDRAFNKRNQLANPFTKTGKPPFDYVVGSRILVNGAVQPFTPVSPRRYRLRLLNASNFRSYNVHCDNGLEMIQIATEAGLMPNALRRNRILIGPGERAELLVDFADARGKRVRLVSSRRNGAPNALGSKAYEGAIMQFRVASEAVPDETAAIAHLDPLRPLPDWVAAASTTPSFDWDVTVSQGSLRPRWLLNGESYNPGRSQVTAEKGEVVTWKLHNRTQFAHLMHLHHTDWYMLKRNGADPPAHERCLKETFFLDPFESVVIAGKMSDYTGKYVVHCHMLEHEDHGLMSQFEVVEPAQ